MSTVYKYLLVLLLPVHVLFARNWIDQCIDLTIHSKFDSALAIAESRRLADPADYTAWFYIAATLNARMVHFENTDSLQLFETAVDSTLEITERLLESESQLAQRAQLLFYRGSALGYRAYVQGREGEWYSAVPNGLKATSLLKDAVETDSTLYDAYLGIGTYKYWLFSKLKFITWLPVVPDDREEGIALIRKAMALSKRTRYMAMHQLIYVLIDFDETHEATILADTLMAKYPNSQFMWWAATQAWFKDRDYEKAQSAYLHLDSLLAADPNANPRHRFKCRYRLAYVAFHLDDTVLAKSRAEEALQMAQNYHLDGSSENDIDDLQSMLEQIEEKQ